MSSKPSIFISYRRDDSDYVADRIYECLIKHFGEESVFFDIDTIPLGVDFEEYIDAAVSQCQIFLAIIGRAWLTITDDEGVPRLESETDFVRLEIESALKREIPVIPLLVSWAKMPKKSELPESLRKLVSSNGAQIRSGKDFQKDADDLIRGVEAHFGGSSFLNFSPGSPPRRSKPRLQGFSFEVVTIDSSDQTYGAIQESAEHFLEELGDGVTLDMVRIPGGEFLMGSPDDEQERYDSEGPQHLVTVPEFFIGRYPVTQAQWQVVAHLEKVNRELNWDPSKFKGANRPVELVSWNDAVEFCARLSLLTGRPYSLPSEAQWEYACRAATITPFHVGDTLTSAISNYNAESIYSQGIKGNCRKQTTDVGQFLTNSYGLQDMHGNVFEWCQDFWHDCYARAPKDGSAWLCNKDDNSHIVRGGSWYSDPGCCRSAYRINLNPDEQHDVVGFRVLCTLSAAIWL